MEKLLAMSILSATPAEISGSWMNLASSKKMATSNNSADNKKCCPEGGQRPSKASERSCSSQKPEQKKGARLCWFAPEFDGIDFFETLVAH